MNLFKEDSSLQSINDMLSSLIPHYRILGDLPLSREDYNLLASEIEKACLDWKIQEFSYLYMESFSVFLVFCAIYEYKSRNFWQPVEGHLGELPQNRRAYLYNVFSKVLDLYCLNHFENESEEGLTYVTPILCHAGITIHALDNYFEAISNTVNDSFYDDFDVNDYLSYLKNKTEITVKRYLGLTNKRDAYIFIQSTKKLISTNVVEHDEELNYGNYFRMVEYLSLWKEKPRVKKSLQARRNVQITAPKIKIDLVGVGVYGELPRIIVKDAYDTYITWEISTDDDTKFIKSDFYRRGGFLVSEEKLITLKPAQSYTFSLIVDDNVISNWEFVGVRNDYIAFHQNNNVIKTEALPNKSVIILLNKDIDIIDKEKLKIEELPAIPLWTNFDVYSIDLSDLKLLSCSNGLNIQIHSEDKPVLYGGETIFGQENSRSYIELPSINVPVINNGDWHLDIKHKAGSICFDHITVTVSTDFERIPLSTYITQGAYGEYEIKIWNRTGINGKFNLEYVPFSKLLIDKNEYWPSMHQGYINNIKSIWISNRAEVEIFNAEKLAEINHDDHLVCRYKINEQDRFLIGEYRYLFNEYTFSTTIKKSIHPVSWGIIGVDNDAIDLSSKVYSLTLQRFSEATDPYLLFAFDFSVVDIIDCLKLELIAPDKSILSSNTLTIKDKSGIRIPLNPYLFEMQNHDFDVDYQLCVSLIDSNGFQVVSFIVARFHEEIAISNAQIINCENNISITWNENGVQSGRECVLFNLLKPWKNPYHFRIKDQQCEINIDSSQLEEGIYRYIIQKESDELFTDEEEAEICSLNNFQKGKFIVKGKHQYSSEIEKFLSRLLKSRFLKKEIVPRFLEQLKSEINDLRIKIPEDIYYLSCAYIVNDRFFSKKKDSLIVKRLFQLLFDLLSDYGEEILHCILESNFSNYYKKKLLHRFYCNNLTSSIKINDIQLELLKEIDEDMYGFIHLIESKNKAAGLNWAGISDINILREDELFDDEDSESTFLSDENLGKTFYIEKYYNYVANSLSTSKNFKKSTNDFIREFQKEQSIEETKIFGKTRLHLLAEWKESHRNINKIQDRLSHVISFPCKADLKHTFEDVFQAISKRRVEDELGYYIGLITLYGSFIRNGLMKENKVFRHLLNYTIKKCGKLYYRDAIIIELYMRIERGFTWV